MDPTRHRLTQNVLDWLDRPAFALECRADGDYIYQACNPAFLAAAGLPSDVLLGQDFSIGFALGEADKLRAELDIARSQRRRHTSNHLTRWASGWIGQSLTISPVGGDLDGPPESLVVIADISSPEKLHHAALQAAEHKVRDFAELASDWFWETDSDHRFSWISSVHDQTLGELRKRCIGHQRWDIASGDNESFWDEHRAQLERHETFRDFRYCAMVEDREIWIEIAGKPVFDAEGHFMGYRGSGRDISEHYRQQRRIEAALQRAEEASRAKSQFLANMSHELRTPLNAIIGFSEIIRDQMFGPVGVPRYVDYARDINASGSHLLAVIGDILDMSRIEAGYYALDEKTVDLTEVILSALTMVRPQAERAGITLRNLCPDGLPQVRADERVVKQVLINLLGNAVKFTPQGGSIDVVYRPLPDGTLSMSVVDTGIGIPPEHLDHIFEPFQLAKAEVARQHGGTGLGLSISKRLMELHGGGLSLISNVGQGTEARLTLPAWRLLDDADAEWLGPIEEPPPLPAPPRQAVALPAKLDNSVGDTLRGLLEVMGEGVIVIDKQGIIASVSPSSAQLFGYASEDLIGQNVRQLMPEPFRSGHDSYIRNYLTTSRPKILGLGRDTLARRRNGEIFPIHICVGEFDNDGDPGFIALVRDISDRRDVELKAEFASRNDPLTGILNRASFIQETERMLEAGRRQEGPLWIIVNLDVDGFRDINEGFGFHIGDMVLKTVAERLTDALPREALVGRIAADQFAALAAVNDLNNAMNLAQTLHAQLTRPIPAEGRLVTLKISSGVALLDDPSDKISEGLAKAELAQKLVRAAGGDSTRFYSPEMTRVAERRLRLSLSLEAAMQNDEFHLVFQPIVESRNGNLSALEALLRWNHPELGAISPAEFIPLAEENGAIIPITRWVIEHVIKQISAWLAEGLKPRRVFVNVSGQQFLRDDMPAYFLALRERHPDILPYLGIEITEQAAIQNMEETVRAIRELASIGVDAALDDFGTGYSSLSYIQRLPLRKIKLDRGFIKDLPENDKDVALVRAMIGMANGLNLPVVAEGVETEAQFAFLRSVDCQEMQGFLISRPVGPEEIRPMLVAGTPIQA